MTLALYGKSKRRQGWLIAIAVAIVVLAAVAGTTLRPGGSAQAADTTVVVSGNTAAGENLPGWMFNRDPDNATPYQFNNGAASIGSGGLYVEPIDATAAAKFIGELFMLTPMSDVTSISYDFKIGSGGDASDGGKFYANVYANFASSLPTKYYDCRYSVVPATGSTGAFTTVTFDPSSTYPVTTSGTSLTSPCPASPAAMGPGATLRAFVLNVGDTTASDLGLDGYLDNVVTNLTADTTTYDFDPACAAVCYADAVNGNDGFGGASAGNAKKTIQAAVNQVSANGTVHVAAGTYVENVVIPKSLTVQGAGASTIVTPAVSSPNPCIGSSLCGAPGTASNVFLVQASNVTIRELVVDGDNTGLPGGIEVGGANIDARNGIIENYYAGVFDGLTVANVTVKNVYLRGIYAASGGTGFNFHDNVVQNVQGESASIGIFNFGGSGVIQNNTVSWANDAIASNWSTGTQYLNNTVTHSGSGVHTDNNGGFGGIADLLQGNTVSDCMPDGYGVWTFVSRVSPGPVVSDNQISGCTVGLAVFGRAAAGGATTFAGNRVDGGGAAGSVGAYISTENIGFGPFDVSADLTGNTLVHNDVGVQVVEVFGVTAAVSGHYNVIAGNAVDGLDTDAAATLDFTDNWWGCSGGPADTSNCNGTTGSVDANPWLVNSITIPVTVAAVNTTITGTVDLRVNSDGVQPVGTVPDGTTVVFASSPPGVTGAGTTVGGQATVLIATGPSSNVFSVCAQVPGIYGAPEGCTLVAVYDPTAGFVTGGGWFNSPAGAFTADAALTGKATFGFVSKYQKGKTTPTGNTQFEFKLASMKFESTSYEWLVVAGARAQYKGIGTINGLGDYGFMLTAIDGQVNGGGGIDKFRIKIWDKTSGDVVYDNNPAALDTADPTTTLGGGSIVIHK